MRKFLFILFIAITTCGYSQISNSKLKKTRRTQSIEQIKDLKNGALLIRLQTKKKAIAALRERGYNETADFVEKEQADHNKEIVDAFILNFHFCPYYFFASENSTCIKNGQFDSINFLNHNLEPDKTIRPKITKYFISEICPIESDTMKRYSGTNTGHGKTGLEKTDAYYSSGTFGFEALIIRSDQFVQLSRPFPYYVRTWSSWRKPKVVVRKMNANLNYYYQSK